MLSSGEQVTAALLAGALIELKLNAKVPGITDEKFNELAKEAKENCPISGVLNCQINLNSHLV